MILAQADTIIDLIVAFNATLGRRIRRLDRLARTNNAFCEFIATNELAAEEYFTPLTDVLVSNIYLFIY